MATFYSEQSKSNSIVPGHGFGGTLNVAWGTINIAANPADGDIYKMFWLPAGFLVLGGTFVSADLDTGTEELDIDVGWAADGSSAADTTEIRGKELTSSGNSASVAGFVNSGVLTGDAVAGLTSGGNVRLIMPTVPLWFAERTMVQLEANAASATFAAGDATLTLYGQIYRK